MTDEGFKRKLTAILSADVIGYSRLMRDDEEATVRDIAAHRVLISDIIQQHNGRVIDSPGDNILAEFSSVVDAVNGAIKIQDEIKGVLHDFYQVGLDRAVVSHRIIRHGARGTPEGCTR